MTLEMWQRSWHRLDAPGMSRVLRSLGFVLRDGAMVAEVQIWPSSAATAVQIQERAAPLPVEVSTSAGPLPRRL